MTANTSDLVEAVRIIEVAPDVAVDMRAPNDHHEDELGATVETSIRQTLGRLVGRLRVSAQAELLVNLVRYGARLERMDHIRLVIVEDDPDDPKLKLFGRIDDSVVISARSLKVFMAGEPEAVDDDGDVADDADSGDDDDGRCDSGSCRQDVDSLDRIRSEPADDDPQDGAGSWPADDRAVRYGIETGDRAGGNTTHEDERMLPLWCRTSKTALRRLAAACVDRRLKRGNIRAIAYQVGWWMSEDDESWTPDRSHKVSVIEAIAEDTPIPKATFCDDAADPIFDGTYDPNNAGSKPVDDSPDQCDTDASDDASDGVTRSGRDEAAAVLIRALTERCADLPLGKIESLCELADNPEHIGLD